MVACERVDSFCNVYRGWSVGKVVNIMLVKIIEGLVRDRWSTYSTVASYWGFEP